MSSESNIVKGGETIVNVGFERSIKGLKVNLKVVPAIEDFMRSCGTGATLDTRAVGHRYWNPIGIPTLMIYELTDPSTAGLLGKVAPGYRLDQPGYPMFCRDSSFNLSFLRIAGISEGEGVSFYIKGVFTEPSIVKIGETCEWAVKAFYKDFLRPVGVYINVSMQQFSPDRQLNMSE